ncbi:transcriptional repressor, CopY family [Bacteroides coprosuis DSM 18011]|uniref:Transcriptional repressor, CopY family n=1 Tax=Bacteroides coprosuis DSM 18011 TaxID=679937 RepID=F3ZPR1_9BACE|nr:transcriptional repressor, CopY family [Bacteroides coprosuis DSM 18011]
MSKIQRLTAREEEIMEVFWSHGEMFVKDILKIHPEPKPHFNTLSTIVRGLEEKGFLSHHSLGNTYQYYALISAEEYSSGCLKGVVSKYFKNSALSAVSTLVKEEDISVEDLKKLINLVEQQKK